VFAENIILDDVREHFGASFGYFEQDDGPAHRAETTITFFQKEINTILDWLANSSD
jgi:hypothetical protein